jgi:hypothetical protein
MCTLHVRKTVCFRRILDCEDTTYCIGRQHTILYRPTAQHTVSADSTPYCIGRQHTILYRPTAHHNVSADSTPYCIGRQHTILYRPTAHHTDSYSLASYAQKALTDWNYHAFPRFFQEIPIKLSTSDIVH